MNTYVFDQGWQKEHDRLAGIKSLYDSYSTQRLAGLGVRDGWHCPEVGFGAGGVALWLAEHVGSTGRWHITLTRPSTPPCSSGLFAPSGLSLVPPEVMPTSARSSSGCSPTPGW